MNNKHRLVAEIEKRITLISELDGDYAEGSLDAYRGILDYIEELPEDGWDEVKGVLF